MINVILDVNIVLDLLLKRKQYFREQGDCFQLLMKRDVSLYFPVCALPTLCYVHVMELKRLQKAGAIKKDVDLAALSMEQLHAFFSSAVKICTSLGAHWGAGGPLENARWLQDRIVNLPIGIR